MIVINKKRIQIIASCLLIALFAFSFQIANENKQEDKNIKKTVETTSTPVSGKTVVLDAGHGVPDERDKMLKLKNKTLQMAIYQRNILVG